MKKSYRSILSIGLLSVLIVSLVFALTGCGFLGRSPTAKIDTDPAVTNGTVSVTTGETVEFDGSGSTASTSDGNITDYDWTFSDEFSRATAAGEAEAVQTGSYDSTGDYKVTLKVTDDAGKTDEGSVDVEVS